MSTRRTLCDSLCLEPVQRLDQLLALRGLQRIADRAQFQRLALVVRDRGHVHRDVAGSRIALELIEHAEPGEIRQIDVEQDRARPILLGRDQRIARRVHHHGLKAHFVSEIAQNQRERHVVLDHQDETHAGGQPVAVVRDGRGGERGGMRLRGPGDGRRRSRACARGSRHRCRRLARHRLAAGGRRPDGRGVFERQCKSERAALARQCSGPRSFRRAVAQDPAKWTSRVRCRRICDVCCRRPAGTPRR